MPTNHARWSRFPKAGDHLVYCDRKVARRPGTVFTVAVVEKGRARLAEFGSEIPQGKWVTLAYLATASRPLNEAEARALSWREVGPRSIIVTNASDKPVTADGVTEPDQARIQARIASYRREATRELTASVRELTRAVEALTADLKPSKPALEPGA